jgi:preprotein translocase subunit YajC
MLPLLQLMVLWFVASYNAWFVVSLIMPRLLPLLQLIVLWFVVFLIRDNKPQHHELQERQQTQLYKRRQIMAQ